MDDRREMPNGNLLNLFRVKPLPVTLGGVHGLLFTSPSVIFLLIILPHYPSIYIYRSAAASQEDAHQVRTPQDSQALRMKLTLSPYDTKYCRPSLMPLPPRTVCVESVCVPPPRSEGRAACGTPASWTLTRLKTTFALSDRAVLHSMGAAPILLNYGLTVN
eukprot:gene8105-5641_t